MTDSTNDQAGVQPAAGGVEDVQLPGSGALEPAETPVAPAAGTGEPQPPGPDGAPATTQADLEAAREAEQQGLGDDSDLDDADLADDTADPSAGVNDAGVTQPNPYAGPLGYTGKFATDGKAVTDSDAPDDQLQAGAGDQLDQQPADQLDQQPPA